MKRQPYVEVFKDRAGEWRWRKVAVNGQIVSVSGEGYVRESSATKAAKREHPNLLLTLEKQPVVAAVDIRKAKRFR